MVPKRHTPNAKGHLFCSLLTVPYVQVIHCGDLDEAFWFLQHFVIYNSNGFLFSFLNSHLNSCFFVLLILFPAKSLNFN